VVATGTGLSVALEGPGGELLASVRSSESLGLLPVDGPICVREPGPYRATVHLASSAPEATNVAMQVWQSGRD
jgi:hypothetical protein